VITVSCGLILVPEYITQRKSHPQSKTPVCPSYSVTGASNDAI